MADFLTNQQQFSMVNTLIDHRNDVKIFKTQVGPPWIHGTTSRRRVFSQQSFEHYDVISMVAKSIEHGKLLSIYFLQ